jgi:hypothetical protein
VVCDWYEVQGHRFGIRSTSDAFASWLRYGLGAHRTQPTPEEEDRPRYSIVVDDGARTAGRVGRGYNILYVGTMDVVRTLDLRFLARCLFREIDTLGCAGRKDAVFIRTGVLEAAGRVALFPSFLVPMLCAARRRAEKRGIKAPGGSVAALDPITGELTSPVPSIDVPADAIESLERYVPGAIDGARDHFPIEDGERRQVDVVIGLKADQTTLADEKPRSETALELAMAARNMHVLGGSGFRAIGEAVRNARSIALNWSSTDEMLEALTLAMRPTTAGTDSAVAEIRPEVDEPRKTRP